MAAAASLCAPWAGAQIDRPQSANRRVGHFDFEERENLLEPVPMHWVRVVHNPPEHFNPGYPPWNESGFDNTHAVSGNWSVRLPTSGGSAALRLSGGVLAAIPGADYTVSAKVRTTALNHARARIRARFLDESLRPIEASERVSGLVRSPHAWADTGVDLQGDFPGAAWIQIELELLQPAQHTPRDRRRHDLTPEDFHAAAWFDDVAVHQSPRLTLATNAPTNVVIAPDTPKITAQVRDLTGERLTGNIEVRDMDGRLIDARDFEGSGRGSGFEWAPRLERFGWHRATLRIEGDGRLVALSEIDFVWAPRAVDIARLDSLRFGVVSEEVEAEQFEAVPRLLETLGLGFVHLPLWRPGQDEDSFARHLAGLEHVVNRLLDRGVQVTLTLPAVPGNLAAELQIDRSAALELVRHPVERWSSYLDPALSRFGQRVRRWQAGQTGDDGHHDRPELSQKTARLQHLLERLSPEPRVALPWRADRAVDTDRTAGASLTLSLPAWSPPEATGALLGRWRDAGVEDFNLVFERADPAVSTARWRVGDLVKRAVSAASDNNARIAIEQPWWWSGQTVRVEPELAAWRTIVEMLAGRTVLGELPSSLGVRAVILQTPAGASPGSALDVEVGAGAPPRGMIVAWSQWADPAEAFIEGYFGAQTLTVVDVFGNERAIEARQDGTHRVQLGRTPVFIVGVDERVAMFRGEFRVEPAFLVSLAARHQMEVVISNPWNTAISGKIRIAEPESWDIAPRLQNFSIPAGGEVRLPISATIGVGEEAGLRTLRGELELLADREHPMFRVSAPVQVGLENLVVTATARRATPTRGGADDMIVSMLITNTGRTTVTVNTFAVAPGFPRQQAPVSGLEPGASTIRQFIFRGGADALHAQRIRVGVLDPSGPIRLNHSIVAP